MTKANSLSGWSVAAALLMVSALAAGCGAAHEPQPSAADAGKTGAGTASASATPVPTVTGGATAAGGDACVGWPTQGRPEPLPATFDAVAVERCVSGVQQVPGKGEWQTATLEKATTDLDPVIAALRRLPVQRLPGIACPEIATVPQELLVTGAGGQELIPLLPAGRCGVVQEQLLAALAALHWQPVSVRLIAPISDDTVAPRIEGSVSPKVYQTLSAQENS